MGSFVFIMSWDTYVKNLVDGGMKDGAIAGLENGGWMVAASGSSISRPEIDKILNGMKDPSTFPLDCGVEESSTCTSPAMENLLVARREPVEFTSAKATPPSLLVSMMRDCNLHKPRNW